MLNIDEVRCVFLSQSPVELLHRIRFECISHTLRGYLEDPQVLRPLCDNNHLPPRLNFVSFLEVYNRKYLLSRPHEQWYVNIYAHTLPLNKLLARAAKYQHYDLLDSVLNKEMLWCSIPHMVIVCSRIREKTTVKKYIKKTKAIDGLGHRKVRYAHELGCMRHGVGVPIRGEFDMCKHHTTALGNGYWDLALRLIQYAGLSITWCVLKERRFDARKR